MSYRVFEKLLKVKDILDKGISGFLMREGYNLRDVVLSNLDSDESAEPITEKPSISLKFVNEDAEREIEFEVDINYLPYLTISNNELDESFDFHDYYKHKVNKMFQFKELFGSNEHEKLEYFLELLSKEFGTNLLKLIRGKEWQDIPEDWGPYK